MNNVKVSEDDKLRYKVIRLYTDGCCTIRLDQNDGGVWVVFYEM